jgi:hydrogenase maturation factor
MRIVHVAYAAGVLVCSHTQAVVAGIRSAAKVVTTGIGRGDDNDTNDTNEAGGDKIGLLKVST